MYLYLYKTQILITVVFPIFITHPYEKYWTFTDQTTKLQHVFSMPKENMLVFWQCCGRHVISNTEYSIKVALIWIMYFTRSINMFCWRYTWNGRTEMNCVDCWVENVRYVREANLSLILYTIRSESKCLSRWREYGGLKYDPC